ncbi:MAG: DUF2085 domain-containing protein [Treponema sp.]|nr:DUF2085 domain-containing protein [Candidatus Treponema equifaecale]
MNWGKSMGCHQIPNRSFFYKGYQFPICARCTGVFISAFISLICVFLIRIPISICVLMSFVMLIDWLVQAVGIKQSTNKRRLLTGLIGGFGYTTLYYYFVIYLSRLFKSGIVYIFHLQ